MTPTIPQPEPLPLPGPAWLFWGLLMLTFFLHVLAMNALLGGSILAAHARLRRAGNVHARQLVDRFVRSAPALVAATVTLGVAPLLFVQVLYGRLFFVSSVLMAWLWLAVVPALMFVYYAVYVLSFTTKRRATPAWLHVATAAVLLGIAFLYTTNMTLMLRADTFSSLYAASGRGLHLNMSDPTLLARWTHMIAGAIAVAGLVVVAAAAAVRKSQPLFAAWASRYGATWSALATAVNVAAGVVWLFAVPRPIVARFLQSALGGGGLVIGAVAGFTALVLLVAIARGGATTTLVSAASAAMLISVAAMLFARDALRTAALDEIAFAPTQWVEPQWVAIALFAVLLWVAVGAVGWMVYALRRASAAAPTRDVSVA